MYYRSWLDQVFSARQALTGGVIRRSVESISEFSSLEAFIAEVQRRGFHAVRSGGQVVVFCSGQLEMLC